MKHIFEIKAHIENVYIFEARVRILQKALVYVCVCVLTLRAARRDDVVYHYIQLATINNLCIPFILHITRYNFCFFFESMRASTLYIYTYQRI